MRLSDILKNGTERSIRDLWETAQPAGEMGPLPPGEYICHIVKGELVESRTNATPSYKLTFRVIEGPLSGRQFWHDCWLTDAAMPQTKRDLMKLGVASLDELDHPLRRFFRCRCKLVLRRDDDGNERNRLRAFEVIGLDPPESDAFAPTMPTEPKSPNPASVVGSTPTIEPGLATDVEGATVVLH